LPVVCGDQRRHQIRHQPQHQHLAFRIAEADIVFDQLRAALGDHQPGKQHASVGRAHRLHGAHGRLDDLVHYALVHFRRHDRRRRIGAHAAGVGTLVAVADALVVLRRGKRDRGLAVAQREERGFLADQTILDHDFPGRLPEAAAEHHVDGGFGFRHRLRHHHALTGGKPIGLHHDRRAFFPHVVLGRSRALEALVSGGRNLVGLAQVLGETLGAFQPRRPFARAERSDAGGLQVVDDAGAQRHFRPDHHQVNLLRLAERDHRLMVGEVERHALGLACDAGIAGRAIKLLAKRARRHFPGQRVFASAGTEDEDVHERRGRALRDARHLV
jgi:hypothetical protein